jgi:hypothetical protein
MVKFDKTDMKYRLKNTFILLFAGMLFLSNTAKAGEKFCILSIFEKYGHQKGVVMLEASKKLLKQYKIKMFKSIIFEDGTEALPDIRTCIEKDKANAVKIKEIVHYGLLMSGFYRLRTEKPEINRFLIFRVQEKKTTLIYVEGELTTDELVELLK